ncbi:hypothetical protein [Streptomyces sp. HSG2]|uniref:hypothetical protein n=1 Tax=Streptomyces sp. HSG2 TaxID=2797167 RepID=UPI001F5B0241|nr:hypothetical protein [Streptomyces sp. HSG2]
MLTGISAGQPTFPFPTRHHQLWNSGCRKAGARFSLAVAVRKKIRETIAAIPEDAWTPIKYAAAIWDADEERRISDAEISEVPFTAFTSKKKAFHTTPG